MKKRRFVNRDISWLAFNSRVLAEAEDEKNPLLERLKFLAITAGNLDEFMMVRVAETAAQCGHGPVKVYKNFYYEPEKLLEEIYDEIRHQVKDQYKLWNTKLIPALEEAGIHIAAWKELTPAGKNAASRLMQTRIYPVLTPIGIDQSHPFPLVPNLAMEMLIRLVRKGEKEEKFALLEVPQILPRFFLLERKGARLTFITCEELIRNHLEMLFAGCTIKECTMFRVTRDMDWAVKEEQAEDLLTEMQSALREKTRRKIIHLEFEKKLSDTSRSWLLSKVPIHLAENCLIQELKGMLNLKGLLELATLKGFPELLEQEQEPLPSPHLLRKEKIFDTIKRKGGFLLHTPYESFDPVVRFLEEASRDPGVLAIKQTLYRIGNDSPNVKALINAARNGKQVTVLLELKARFDEENNILWARELSDAGAHVVYGIAKLKVHCKALMVVRKEPEGIQRYVHLSSGNYNFKTAKTYTDIGYFSCDPLLAGDVSALFNVITGFSTAPQWNHLLVAPFNLMESLLYRIDRESRISTKENPGHIIIKINALLDHEIIEHLYMAAKKHVRIDLIVRGICALSYEALPEEAAKNIRVISILDRYLEHGRIYYFRNNGASEYFAGSADLMPRNLRRRIELLFPIEDPALRRELDFILATQLADTRKGHTLSGCNCYTKEKASSGKEEKRSQKVLYDFYKKRLEEEEKKNHSFSGEIKVFHNKKGEE